MIQALPWFLFAFALLLLVIELLVSHNTDAKAQLRIAELVQQQRIDQADIDEARAAYHRVVGERDRARATVQSTLDAQRRWHDLTQPLPMPADVDDELTTEFNKIVGRHAWRPDTQS